MACRLCAQYSGENGRGAAILSSRTPTSMAVGMRSLTLFSHTRVLRQPSCGREPQRARSPSSARPVAARRSCHQGRQPRLPSACDCCDAVLSHTSSAATILRMWVATVSCAPLMSTRSSIRRRAPRWRSIVTPTPTDWALPTPFCPVPCLPRAIFTWNSCDSWTSLPATPGRPCRPAHPTVLCQHRG